MRPSRWAFSLVELLVVITIIVVLLALLAPALDKAVYHAEMLRCAAQIKGVITSVQAYAAGSNRWYPPRKSVAAASPRIFAGAAADDRPLLKSLFPVNALLRDPFIARKVDLEKNQATSQVYGDYGLWFGFTFTGSRKGARKLGERWEWTDTFGTAPVSTMHSVLVGDMDIIYREPSGGPLAQSAHNDAGNRMAPVIADDTTNCFLHMRLGGSYKRDPIDLNYGFADASVKRYDRIKPRDDERMAVTPWSVYANGEVMQAPLP